MSLPKKIGYVAMFVLIYFLLNNHMILGVFQNIYDHFKTLTYGVLFIIPILACAKPNKVEELLEK